MPRDTEFDAMAKSGLADGKGKGNFSGMPEGSHSSVPEKINAYEARGHMDGTIVGAPNGIHTRTFMAGSSMKAQILRGKNKGK